ncbi:MAG: nucleoside-specific outer membrane channel protein Tsx [Oceanicoccus sp.]|jgi:nucleoside-specific outer membrane channel protein Tsx
MKTLTLGLLLAASSLVNAETFFKDQSLSVLQGSDYELGDNERVVMTYEYLSVHNWGDVFGFVDRLVDQNNGGAETYIELSPNFNLVTFESGLVNSVKLATTWEMNENDDQFLLGLGAGLNLPGFTNFSVSAYQRFNDSGEDNQQVTVVWGLPFNVAGQDFMFDGFWDYTTELNDTTSSNFTPQLKWDMAKLVGYENKLFVGVEYVMWNDKFNIKGVDENNVNLLVKAHF